MDLRPAQAMLDACPSALSTAELLAIILRVGNRGENVIRLCGTSAGHFGGVAGLAQANMDELQGIHGIGRGQGNRD